MNELKELPQVYAQSVREIQSADSKVPQLTDNVKSKDSTKLTPEEYANQLNALEKIADIWASGVANSMNEYERIAKSDNEGKASANEVVRDSKKRYNKTYTDEFRTNAMIWANSSTTQVGDTKILNNKGKNFVLIEATENGYVEIESGSYDALKGAKEYYETTNKARKILDRYAESLENERGRDDWSFSVIENSADEGRTVGLDSGKSNSHQQRNNERSGENSQKFSTKLNSEGEQLSEGQAEYFKDSKVRDEDGNLLKVYHGTSEDFTVFDRTKGRHNMDIQGSFFSPWELDAQGYGENVKAYYLNITNPASEQMGYKALRMFRGQNNAGVKAREYLESLGYDGVNNGNEEYIAFNSNQIKLADNLNPTDNEDVRYSNKSGYDYSKTFAEQIDDYLQGNLPKYDTFVVSGTPEVFQKIGLASLPMTYTQKHLEQNLNGDADHKIPKSALYRLPDALKKPIAIFASATQKGRVVSIVDLSNTSNKNLLVAVELDGAGTSNGNLIDSNHIASVYGRSNIENLVSKALINELAGGNSIFYLDKNKAINLLNTSRVQFSGLKSLINGFNHKITDNPDFVNSKFTSQTQTKQFKRWFGKSKVVDKNGNPLVVYHGTNKDFSVFDNSKYDGIRHSLHGNTNWFTDSEKTAQKKKQPAKCSEVTTMLIFQLFLKLVYPIYLIMSINISLMLCQKMY